MNDDVRSVLYIMDTLGLSGRTKGIIDLALHLDPRRYRPIFCSLGNETSELAERLHERKIPIEVLPLPAGMKMNGERTKSVLKDAAHAWLPEDVVERTKQGFRVPLPAWLRGELAPWAEDLLRRSPLRELGIFDFDYILDLWKRHREGEGDHSFDLWCLINLSGWYEHWFAA